VLEPTKKKKNSNDEVGIGAGNNDREKSRINRSRRKGASLASEHECTEGGSCAMGGGNKEAKTGEKWQTCAKIPTEDSNGNLTKEKEKRNGLGWRTGPDSAVKKKKHVRASVLVKYLKMMTKSIQDQAKGLNHKVQFAPAFIQLLDHQKGW